MAWHGLPSWTVLWQIFILMWVKILLYHLNQWCRYIIKFTYEIKILLYFTELFPELSFHCRHTQSKVYDKKEWENFNKRSFECTVDINSNFYLTAMMLLQTHLKIMSLSLQFNRKWCSTVIFFCSKEIILQNTVHCNYWLWLHFSMKYIANLLNSLTRYSTFSN